MNIHVKKYRKIVDKLISKSFPELKGKRIKIIEYGITKSYAGFIPIINLFGVHRRCRNFSNKELEALLAHELSHYEMIFKIGFFEKISFFFRYVFIKRVQAWFETAADKSVIKKGYARGLYELVKRVEKVRTKEQISKRKNRGYLSSKQIKQYVKK